MSSGGCGDQMTPKLTIVCASYRRYEHLPILIHSIMAQTIQNFRLLILHDGPDERMHSLLIRYQNEFPDRMRFMFTEKRYNDYGHSLRDLGIKEADGEFILITNDDKYYSPQFIEFMMQA